jgi:hypothetical protein
MGRSSSRMQEGWNAFKMLTGKCERKRLLGKPGLAWEDNIRMDLKEICVNNSAEDRDYWRALANVTLNLLVQLAMELVT